MDKEFPLVSIIIDNWNGKHFLKRCLDSLLAQKYPNFELIVIDDASTDGSQEVIKSIKSKVERQRVRFILIENKRHFGFAIVNNQGIKIAKGKYVLLLNNDTKVTKDFLFPLVDLLEKNSEVAAAQSKILVMDDPTLLDDVASYLTPFGFLYHIGFWEKDKPEFNRRQITFSPKGACFFIKKAVLDEVGLMDDRFYCYFEESDLAWRMWLAGYKIFFEPKSVIYHVIAGSMKKQTSANRDYFAVKNRLNSLITNLSPVSLALILPLHLIFLFGFICFYLIRSKWKNIGAIFRAVLWNIINFKSTMKKRAFVQKKVRKVSDRSIFKEILKMPPRDYYVNFIKIYLTAGDRKLWQKKQ